DFRNKFRGNVDIYLNKYDPKTVAWVPLSECPFTFWDLNSDGHSDIVLRVSAAPLSSNSGSDPDYANHYDYMWAPEATPLAQTGNMNVRFSYNLDPEPRREPVDKPHFTFGFNLVGTQPYDYPGMRYTHPRLPPPGAPRRLSPLPPDPPASALDSTPPPHKPVSRGMKLEPCSAGKASSGSLSANTCPIPAVL